ncbi:MAG: PfaD family polyunsaturated fatty acid/polyketide biosynthesis protein [Acidobacteriota bacterium]
MPAALQADAPADAPWTVIAQLPALYPEWLGDRSFTELHGVRFPYVAGAMANGIASTELVCAMANAGFLSFFGAAGLDPGRIEAAIDTIEARVGSASWGSNLIHSPNEPDLEAAVADLYVRRGVRRVSAAAYMSLTPFVVQYAYHGLKRDAQGAVQRKNHLFAKISRPEVARRFMEPAPAEMLQALVAAGKLTAAEAEIGATLPVAQDYTVESDSGGHTDNRPLTALLPTIAALRDDIVAQRGDGISLRLGAAGGLGTPAAVAAAFSLGAAYVVTGSVNQGCVESGLHEDGKKMLAQAGLADVVMAPAADMFELGVEVQVLQRGTLFAARARKLYELYRAHDSLEAIPADERQKLERDVLRATVEESWQSTRDFWIERDPREAERGDADAKHRMALVFRSYLGQASKWAIHGLDDRRGDYQIWCGPAMGAFNAWAAGSFLEEPAQRSVVQVARNLMEGAAQITRAQQLRVVGVPMPASAFDVEPRLLA